MHQLTYEMVKPIPWLYELRSRSRQCSYACKNQARWEYEYSPQHCVNPGKQVLVCTPHLLSILLGDKVESRRYNSWWSRWGKQRATADERMDTLPGPE